MTDPRLGLPSGSSALEDSLCHGRFHLQKQWDEFNGEIPENAPPLVELEPADIDSDREAGRRIHQLYAGEQCPNASYKEAERAEKARQVDEDMKGLWYALFESEPIGAVQELRERRWWLCDDSGKEIYSGQTDVVWVRGNANGSADILIGDLKGLWGHHDPASLNMQIRRYIALIAVNTHELGLVSLHSAMAYLNQPAITMTPTPALFDEEDIAKAVLEMRNDVAAMSNPNAVRIAGPVQCQHCRAKLVCPEYQRAQTQVIATFTDANTPPTRKEIFESLGKLDGLILSRIVLWAPAMKHAAEIAVSVAKQRLAVDPKDVPYWRLKKNSDRTTVDDLNIVYSRLKEEFGVNAMTFTKYCSITKVALEQLMREELKLGKGVKQKMSEIIKGATKTTKVVDSLERIP